MQLASPQWVCRGLQVPVHGSDQLVEFPLHGDDDARLSWIKGRRVQPRSSESALPLHHFVDQVYRFADQDDPRGRISPLTLYREELRSQAVDESETGRPAANKPRQRGAPIYRFR